METRQALRALVITDRQQNRVYDWERINVAKHDTKLISIDLVPMIVEHVWKNEGLKFHPVVELLPDNAKHLGDATRTMVRFKRETYTWIVLHELAHSMTSECSGVSNYHGSIFMGVYIQLLSRYLNLPYSKLVDSALNFGLKVKLDANVVFV